MVKLLQGDCLKMLSTVSDGSADLIVTDPPYGMDYSCKWRKDYGKGDKLKNDTNLDWLDEFAQLCYDKLADNSAAYVFCSFHHIDKFKQAFEKVFKFKNILVWEKNNTSMGDLKGDFASKTEFIILVHKGRCLLRGRRDHNILKFDRTRNTLHPTQKPVDLLEFLISKFSDEGDLVLDPFMGSGSTGEACKNTGRHFIGIELDEKHFNTAKTRLKS